MNNLYRGMSTKSYIKTGSLSLRDLELVKEDILNHIWTRKGERVYMPDYGTDIADIIFEPLDNITVNRVKESLVEVIKQDPRVKLLSINVQPYYPKNTILATISLQYLELNMVDDLSLNIQFEN